MTDLILCDVGRGRRLILTTKDRRTWLKFRNRPHTEAEAERIAGLMQASVPAMAIHRVEAILPDAMIPEAIRHAEFRIL